MKDYTVFIILGINNPLSYIKPALRIEVKILLHPSAIPIAIGRNEKPARRERPNNY